MNRHAFISLLLVLMLNGFPAAAQDGGHSAIIAAPLPEANVTAEPLDDVNDLEDYVPPVMFDTPTPPTANEPYSARSTGDDEPEISVFKIKEDKRLTTSKAHKKMEEILGIKNEPESQNDTPADSLVVIPLPEDYPLAKGAPIPPHRPSIVRVSPEYLAGLQARQGEQQRSTPHSIKSEPMKAEKVFPGSWPDADSSSNTHSMNPDNDLPGRLSVTDIHGILAQIDPKAAEELPFQTKKEVIREDVLSRVEATSLPSFQSTYIIEFLPDNKSLPVGMSQNLIDLVHMNAQKIPSMRIEILGFSSNNDREKALHLAMARAEQVKAFLEDHLVDEKSIDIRAMGNKTEIYPYDRVEVIFRRVYGGG